MPVQHIHAFVVHPKKGSTEATQVNGIAIKLEGKMFDLLQSIYAKSEQECDVGITFTPTEGKQQNVCRDLICTYLEDPTLPNGRAIAERLELHTDGRSGTGLLFLIAGKEARDYKIVIPRFPTDNAIYVDEDPRKLTVEFLDRVFMKHKTSYKAVAYRAPSLCAGFWSGLAIDKQLNNPGGEVSNYWIADFLASQLTTTAAQGTKRLATALRMAAQKSELGVKREIVSAATLAANLGGERLSINDFIKRFNLSQAARSAIASELRTPRLANESFRFDASEFNNIIAFKSVELSNGGTLTAPSANFDEVFEQERVVGDGGEVRFCTQGRVINEKLRPRA
jgi:hypothetical protein